MIYNRPDECLVELQVYSGASINGHLHTTATYLQRSFLFVPADGPYIQSHLNLYTTASSRQRQRPLKAKIMDSWQRPVNQRLTTVYTKPHFYRASSVSVSVWIGFCLINVIWLDILSGSGKEPMIYLNTNQHSTP